jgi:hypothetical protein
VDNSIIVRRDLLGADCLSCDEGRYRENWPFASDKVICDRPECRHEVSRHLTKREIAVLLVEDE